MKTAFILSTIIILNGVITFQTQAQRTIISNGANFGQRTSLNVHIGTDVAKRSTGNYNTFLGYKSGEDNTSGSSNTFVGVGSGTNNKEGGLNTFLGGQSGVNNTDGLGNTFVGFMAGNSNTTGSNNVFIGFQAGIGVTGSNKFAIGNRHDNTLLYGDFQNKSLTIGENYASSYYQLFMRGRAYIGEGVFTPSDIRLKKNIH